MPSRPLSAADLTAARRSYEVDRETFQALADRYGVAERTMHRLLVSFGLVPRSRGKQPVEIEAPDLVLADWRAGPSCRAIATKHGLVDHKPVSRFLRSRGIDTTGRPARRKIPGVVLGSVVTNRQAALRRKPPMVIPMRTPAERMRARLDGSGAAGIAFELDAGRFQVVPRGRSGRADDRPLWTPGIFGSRYSREAA